MKICIVVKNNWLLIKAGLVTLCKGVLSAYATHHGVSSADSFNGQIYGYLRSTGFVTFTHRGVNF